MNRFIALSMIVTAALCAPALAQSVDDPMGVATPTISETSEARAEWYRQFIVPQPQETPLLWQAEPTDDFSMEFGTNSRWQLKLDLLSRPSTSPLPREEMQAGANFNITPRFSIGGEVSVGANELDDSSRWEEQDMETGIRLKSAFKF